MVAGASVGAGASRLNRTSVGLKRAALSPPQLPPTSPQSNQRGIETDIGEAGSFVRPTGLNRTSVGLKRELATLLHAEESSLNRTSVGLKLRSFTIEMAAFKCLNRTSVGLKPHPDQEHRQDGDGASIEPAWD